MLQPFKPGVDHFITHNADVDVPVYFGFNAHVAGTTSTQLMVDSSQRYALPSSGFGTGACQSVFSSSTQDGYGWGAMNTSRSAS